MRVSTFLSIALLGCAALCAGIAALSGDVTAQGKPQAIDAKAVDGAGAKSKGGDPKAVKSDVRTTAELTAHINTSIEAVWKAKGLTPSAAADDYEWFRRVSLDLIGRSPNLDEVEEFIALDAKERRAKTLNRLMASNDYAENFSRFWTRALISTGGQEIRFGLRQLSNYLYESVKSNVPYNKMATEILTSNQEVNAADPREANAGGYFVAFRNELGNVTGNISRAFLGVEIQCVQCHDDKIGEPWAQIDFQQMASVFARTTVRRKDNDRANAGYNTWQINDARYTPLSGRALERAKARIAENAMVPERLQVAMFAPKALGEEEAFTGKNGHDLRMAFAGWVTAPENVRFSQTVVNRIWAHFMKRGFVEPIDDFASINEPSMPELLEFMAKDFVANGYDLQRLTRAIVGTRAYQLSSRLDRTATNRDDKLFYSRGYMAQLSSEQLFDSLVATSGLDRIARRRGDTRGLGVIRQTLIRQFRFVIDDDESKEKETFSGTVPQALLMMNSEFVNNAVSASPGGTLSEILRTKATVGDRVKSMYLAALTREPLPTELKKMVSHIESEGGVTAAYEDVFWALVNSAEYLNNH